jgi:hypothetical protein
VVKLKRVIDQVMTEEFNPIIKKVDANSLEAIRQSREVIEAEVMKKMEPILQTTQSIINRANLQDSVQPVAGPTLTLAASS